MGLYLGNVSNLNENKGHISVILNERLAIGDTISFEKEPTKYTVSELMKGKTNLPSASIGTKVTIGRMKGNISIGDKIYKLSSKTLSDYAHHSYNNCENIKVPLNAKIIMKENTPIVMEVSFRNNITQKIEKINVISDILPVEAKSNPITKERIIAQISKTNNTPFEFKKIDIDLEDNLYIPGIRNLNELRRMALSKVEERIIANHQNGRDLTMEKLQDLTMDTDANSTLHNHISSNTTTNQSKEISILLNTIHSSYDYTQLDSSIDRVYIPLKHFIHKDFSKILKGITTNFKVYIYMPSIIKNNYKNVIMHQLAEILESYDIKGFVISNIADLTFLNSYQKDYDMIGNYTLNCFNTKTLMEYKKLGVNRFTLSPELCLEDIHNIANCDLPTELIIYGNTPIMTSNYCLLGHSNKCYPNCTMKCRTCSSYYLKDRLGFEFKVIPDNIQTITTIYNSKTTCITHIENSIPSLRIDILDETIEEINQIVHAAIFGKKLEGKQYTYGNLNREV